MVFLMMFRQVLGQYLLKSYLWLSACRFLPTYYFIPQVTQCRITCQLHILTSESVIQIKLLLQSILSVLIPHTIRNFINQRFHNLKFIISRGRFCIFYDCTSCSNTLRMPSHLTEQCLCYFRMSCWRVCSHPWGPRVEALSWPLQGSI